MDVSSYSNYKLIILIISFNSITAQIGKSCHTPNNELAQCISIYSCRKLYNVVTTKDPGQINFLRESQCGYISEPLVCCGSYDNYQTTTKRPTTTTTRPFSNRDASNKLLPSRSQCGFQNTDRILDGETTGLEEFPWMALLQYRKRNGQLTWSCAGSLISNRYVVTAAHCVTGPILTKIGKLVNVRLGEWNTETNADCVFQLGFEFCSDDPIDVGVEETIAHPDYSDNNPNRYNDIALIRLDRNVQFNDFIKPICLPSSSDQSFSIGSQLFVAGWGRTEYSNSSPVKLKLKIPVVDGTKCSRTFRTAGVNVGTKQLCAGGQKGRDSCTGDSGGPLMNVSRGTAQWYIEGIVSFGAMCGSEGWPGVYTRVSSYVPWINDNIR